MHCLGICILMGKVNISIHKSVIVHVKSLTEELIVLIFNSKELFTLIIVIKTHFL